MLKSIGLNTFFVPAKSQFYRNITYVLKRQVPVKPARPGSTYHVQNANHVYEVVQHTFIEKNIEVPIILKKYIEDIGGPGELVEIDATQARFLLLTNAAVYASPENIKIRNEIVGEKSFSSKFAGTTCNLLSRFVLSVKMNQEEPWVLEPWHIQCAFRRAGVNVPEGTFTMPKQKISGPDLALENKEFIISVTINKTDTAHVRCRIHHWSKEDRHRLPLSPHFDKYPADLILEEDIEIEKTLPRLIPPDPSAFFDIAAIQAGSQRKRRKGKSK